MRFVALAVEDQMLPNTLEQAARQGGGMTSFSEKDHKWVENESRKLTPKWTWFAGVAFIVAFAFAVGYFFN